jgi:hypothetical protein
MEVDVAMDMDSVTEHNDREMSLMTQLVGNTTEGCKSDMRCHMMEWFPSNEHEIKLYVNLKRE